MTTNFLNWLKGSHLMRILSPTASYFYMGLLVFTTTILVISAPLNIWHKFRVVLIMQPVKGMLNLSFILRKDDGKLTNDSRLITKKYDEIIKDGIWYSHI